jgi:hypothetical protein
MRIGRSAISASDEKNCKIPACDKNKPAAAAGANALTATVTDVLQEVNIQPRDQAN